MGLLPFVSRLLRDEPDWARDGDDGTDWEIPAVAASTGQKLVRRLQVMAHSTGGAPSQLAAVPSVPARKHVAKKESRPRPSTGAGRWDYDTRRDGQHRDSGRTGYGREGAESFGLHLELAGAGIIVVGLRVRLYSRVLRHSSKD